MPLKIKPFQTGNTAHAEISRFTTILRRHLISSGAERRRLRKVLIQYLTYSPNLSPLIESLISTCVGSCTNERFDVAIDILSSLGALIQDYADQYLQNDIQGWNRLYPQDLFKPNEDYWYILLRSVAKCSGDKKLSMRILSACQDVAPRQIMEAIVEGLGDLETEQAKALLRTIQLTHKDQFITNLAREILGE